MWRVQGFVGRVLHRYHGSNTRRLRHSHHVEDEVVNSSAVLFTSHHPFDSSSHREEDEERKRKQRTFQFGYAELPRYTALDAVGWGAAAVLFMQICRRIHSQFSSGAEPSPTPGALTASSTLQKCGYRILLETLSRRDVLPRGRSVLCLQGVPERQEQDPATVQSSSSSSRNSCHSISEQDHLTADSSISDHQRELLIQDSQIPEESLLSASGPLQSDAKQNNTEKKDATDEDMLSDKERLAGAAQNLKHVGDTSVPVILNIIGLESAKSENYEEAFACFLAAAQQGYSKAQFNTGVCYEKGRGVSKDKEKALYYYRQAAVGGHRQAQYRYAKLLLTNREHQSVEELNTAMDLLEQAAAAGLTKDDSALLLLGQCCQNGFGTQRNLKTAVDLYKRAAQAGNKRAESLPTPPDVTYAEDVVLRSIRSAPCFSAAGRRLQQPLSSLAGRVPPSAGHPATLPLLPHSWSTGSLRVPTSLSSTTPSSAEGGGTCQWTVGIG
ncbi:death ligand signal enhancer isoform X2 [Brachyistius frenatus]|uniref:death ligand signal enhancer isoform X2 n=1 Tax=Brachyistius frenatus TaxID=100188 RepID=UPI0037E74F50